MRVSSRRSKGDWFYTRLMLGTLALCLSFSASAEASQCQEVSVNGGDDWFPFFFRENQTASGIVTDVVNEAASNISQPLKYRPRTPWKRLLLELRAGRLDMIAGIIETTEAKKYFKLSEPVSEVRFTLFAHRERMFEYRNLSDLVGLKGAKILGVSFGDEVDDFLFNNVVIEETSSVSSLFKMLEVGRVDFIIFGEIAGLEHADRSGVGHIIKPLPTPVVTKSVYVAASKATPCSGHIGELFESISNLKAAGRIDQIEQKYLFPSRPLSMMLQGGH